MGFGLFGTDKWYEEIRGDIGMRWYTTLHKETIISYKAFYFNVPFSNIVITLLTLEKYKQFVINIRLTIDYWNFPIFKRNSRGYFSVTSTI